MSDARVEWIVAFAAAQAEFPPIGKGKTATIPTKSGGEYSYKYADLSDVLDAVTPILHKHGLLISQAPVSTPDQVGVETRIYHTAGHVEVFGPLYLGAGDDARGAGSAITYARRYSLTAALGIATEDDDDGAAAGASRMAPDLPVPQSTDEPHCPACYARDGALVALYENSRAPFWKCSRSADECAGTTISKGKKYSWSGWHEHFEKSRDEWADNQPVAGESVEVETGALTPGQWLADAVKMFTEWDDDERREAYQVAMEALGFERLSSRERAEEVLAHMSGSYYLAYPSDASRPF